MTIKNIFVLEKNNLDVIFIIQLTIKWIIKNIKIHM